MGLGWAALQRPGWSHAEGLRPGWGHSEGLSTGNDAAAMTSIATSGACDLIPVTQRPSPPTGPWWGHSGLSAPCPPPSSQAVGSERPSQLTFPEDWMPLTTAMPTMVQAMRRHSVIFQLRPPLSEMELEMSRASRYQK